MPLPLLSLATVKSRLVLPFWYRLTRVVLEKGPLNGCVCVLLNVMYNKQHVLHPTLLGTVDTKYHLRPRTFSSPHRTYLSLNVILLARCFSKTFIDIMLVTSLFYVFTFLFLPVSSFIYCYFITCLGCGLSNNNKI